MKTNILFFLFILGLFTLASCTKQEQEQITKTLIDDTAMMEQSPSDTTNDTMMEKEDDMMTLTGESDEQMMKEESEMIQNETESMQEDAVMQGTMEDETVVMAWAYNNYDASLLKANETNVIFFHANWCPSCRAADSSLSESQIPGGLNILKADFDTETELKKKYGIVSQHTYVMVDADGNEIKKWVGGTSVDDILERVQ